MKFRCFTNIKHNPKEKGLNYHWKMNPCYYTNTNTTINLEIYDVFRVTFNADITNLTYLWRYMKFFHRIPVCPKGYQNRRQFYDDSSIYYHKLKWEIIVDPLHIYDESSIITIWNEKSSWIKLSPMTFLLGHSLKTSVKNVAWS
jgi:hypothetical protein